MKKQLFSLLLTVIFTFSLSFGAFGANKQEITNFYLSNLGMDSTENWEIKGKKATVEGDNINIETMDANYQMEEDTISVKSQKARLNTQSQNMFLDGDVQIYNQDGWNLKTDYLDWQKNQNQLKTTSAVTTQKDSLLLKARGLSADSYLKRADYQKEVNVVFNDQDKKNATTINCDGPLEIAYGQGIATFRNNVVVKHDQGKLFSDKAVIFFDTAQERIIKIISEGNVKIVRENNITLAKKATYFADKEKLVLEGKPRLIYFPQDDKDATSGFFE